MNRINVNFCKTLPRRLLRSLIVTLLCMMPLITYAADNGAPIWIEATGSARGNDLDPPREVMQRAKKDAEKRAIEQAVGTFIKASSLVVNSQLDHKAVISRVRGRLDKVEVLREERDRNDPDLYRVTLRALVTPLEETPSSNIEAYLTLSSKELSEGDSLSIKYRVSSDAYVYL